MSGYVYIMTSEQRPDICKVGRTSNTPSHRCSQLNASEYLSVTDWKVAHSKRVVDSISAERRVHINLSQYKLRLKKHREAFKIDLEEAIKAVDSVCKGFESNRAPISRTSISHAGADPDYERRFMQNQLQPDTFEVVFLLFVFGITALIMILPVYGFLSFFGFIGSEPEEIISAPTVYSIAYDNANKKYGDIPDVHDTYDTVRKHYEKIKLPDHLNYKNLSRNYNVLEHFKKVIDYVKTDEYRIQADDYLFSPFFEDYYPDSYIEKERDNAEYEAKRISWDDLREMFRITRAIPAEYVYANRIAYGRVADLVRAKQRDGYSDHYHAREASPAWARDVFFTPSLGKKKQHYYYLSKDACKERAVLRNLERTAYRDRLTKGAYSLKKEKAEYMEKEISRLSKLPLDS